MPKLPVVSGKECRKALERLGFKEARERGSHLVMRRAVSGTSPDVRSGFPSCGGSPVE
jgi:predicted RNA binding protein YcfA (HicA-like mRNA interferase family)